MNFSPFISRMLALFLLIVAVCLVLYVSLSVIVLPIKTKMDVTSNLKARYERLQSLENKFVKNAKAYDDATKGLSSRVEFFKGTTAALGSADVQSKIQRFGRSTNCNINSFRVLPVTKYDDLDQLNFRVDLICDKVGLKSFIHRIENSMPFIIVKEARLKKARVSGVTATSKFKYEAHLIAFYGGE